MYLITVICMQEVTINVHCVQEEPMKVCLTYISCVIPISSSRIYHICLWYYAKWIPEKLDNGIYNSKRFIILSLYFFTKVSYKFSWICFSIENQFATETFWQRIACNFRSNFSYHVKILQVPINLLCLAERD